MARGRGRERSWLAVAAQVALGNKVAEDKMADPIELLIQGRAHDLGGGFAVRRVLPSVKRRMVTTSALDLCRPLANE